jgi:hypothetical protein
MYMYYRFYGEASQRLACAPLDYDISVFDDNALERGLAELNNLNEIEELNLSGRAWLTSLPNGFLPGSLRFLNLRRCVRLQNLSDVNLPVTLQELDCHGCDALEFLPDLTICVDLRRLDFSGCDRLDDHYGEIVIDGHNVPFSRLVTTDPVVINAVSERIRMFRNGDLFLSD